MKVLTNERRVLPDQHLPKLAHDLPLQLLLVDGVRLGDDWNDVDLMVKLLHAHQVDALKQMF